MIIFGTGGDLIHLQDLGIQQCAVCGHTSTFSLVVDYRYFHFYWILGFLTSETYACRCTMCGVGWEIEKSKARELHPRNDIPVHQRLGLVIGAGALVGFILLLTALWVECWRNPLWLCC